MFKVKVCVTILSIVLLLCRTSNLFAQSATIKVNYFGDTISIQNNISPNITLQQPLTNDGVSDFYSDLNKQDYASLVDAMLLYKEKKQLDDWLFYQLVRRTAHQLSAKEDNLESYTLYKWFLLLKCGYDAQLAFARGKLLFYVQSNDNIYDIPLFEKDGKQYVCLNIHDTGPIDFVKDPLTKIAVKNMPANGSPFSYRVTQLPDHSSTVYIEKKLRFQYQGTEYEHKVKLDPQVQKMFSNYPSVDFETYFNIPMSRATYGSLIPDLKRKLKGKKQAYAIDYLMKFTRNAFLYQDDNISFGKEKRLSPEQTIMHEYSDCDDRAALFYYLVKEIYNLPMIVLVYPSHITLAIELEQPVGTPVLYKGKKFSLCEPTPQKIDLPIGEIMPGLKNLAYQVVYEYLPAP
ncbi:MAG: hypothetical protein H7Y86_00405 [Rhizobacter sp.]|nr:hypothetical protein [Ferruginibacter sp.]